tara:strand:+ start:1140 stop:1634 length:495 start_codon:yes stop_codon:yes gene_type:complete
MTLVGYTRPSRQKDIFYLSTRLREADVIELIDGDGSTPQEALLSCYLYGKPSMTICKGDETPVAMWGVTPEMNKIGRVWLLGSDELVNDRALRLRFLREAKLHLESLFKSYAVLWNCVDARNQIHIRWLQWMGFTFIAKHPNYGKHSLPFLEFCKTSPCAVPLL